MPRWPFLWRTSPELVEPQVAYAAWAPSYPPKPHNRLMEVEQATVLSLLPDVRGLRALDVGCGSGRYLRELSVRGARAAGLDLSEAMLARAAAMGRPLARADLCALPIGATTVDVIVCGLALGDVADLEVALAQLAAALRPGGCLVYSVVHPAGERAGWSRTFESGGRLRAIEGYWHRTEEHRRACESAGFAITAWEEPVLPEAPACPAALVIRGETQRIAATEAQRHRDYLVGGQDLSSQKVLRAAVPLWRPSLRLQRR